MGELKIYEVKPSLSVYISEAIRLLKDERFPTEKYVHDIRVLMKRARASVLLLKYEANSDAVTREYLAFRDAARLLSQLRDSAVMEKTVRQLERVNKDLFGQLPPDHPIYSPGKEESTAVTEDPKAKANSAAEILQKALVRMRFISTSGSLAGDAVSRLLDTHNRCANAYLESRLTLKPSKIHRLRKCIKEYLYQLEFFRSPGNRGTKYLSKRLESFARDLGKYNDLSQLLKRWGYRYKKESNASYDDELAALIMNLQDKYLSGVWPEAAELFGSGSTVTRQFSDPTVVVLAGKKSSEEILL